MPYFALPNFNHDSGPNRIQSGPDHEGYIVLYSGVESTGPNNGIVVGGAPLSGSPAGGTWDYDSNWRYVPSTLPSQSGSLDPTPYNVSGALDTYNAARIYTRDNVAGAQAASAIGPETGKVNPRGGALQPRADVTRPEKYMYFGGGAPDNQNYSPYNTPDANTAAEGKTGGGVTHRNYESSLLTNLLGSQGTSDRSQWRYHQPVYCKTFTEIQRSATPGLMSSPLRYIYRGSATSYNYNYGSELLANKGGFELLPPDDQVFGCPFPVGCPTNSGSSTQIIVGDTLSAVVYCDFVKIEWFNTNNDFVGTGLTYTVTESDIGYNIYYIVTYFDGSTDQSSVSCFDVVVADSFRYWFQLWQTLGGFDRGETYGGFVDNNGDLYLASYISSLMLPGIAKISNEVSIQWRYTFPLDPAFFRDAYNSFGDSYDIVESSDTTIDFLAWQWTLVTPPYGIDYPVRIYRYRLDKNTGSLLSCIATDFNPPHSVNPSFMEIKDTKIDANGNYYFIFNFAINTDTYNPSVVKFDSNLNFIWCKVFQRMRYRGGGECARRTSNGYPRLTLSDSSLIGFDWRQSTVEILNNYFHLDFDGTVLANFKSKFSTPDFSTDTNPFYVRSVCRDEENYIYGVGTYTADFGVSNVIVYKDSPNDDTIWAFSIGSTWSGTGVGGGLIRLRGNHLLIRESKLVLAAPWEYGSGGGTALQLLICVFDTATGTMTDAIGVRAPTNMGDPAHIQSMPEENKFLVQTDIGYRLRFDAFDLPSSGTYVTQDSPPAAYTVYELTPAQSSTVFYRYSGCVASGFSAPGFTDTDLSSYFTPVVSPVATASGATGGTFKNFAGQDIP